MIKNCLLLFLFVLCVATSDAQTICFFTGKNYTTYDLKYDGEYANTLEKKGEGDSYEIGVSFPIPVARLQFDNPLNYSIGLTLNQYNAEAGNENNSYLWKTEYLGVQNTIAYSFIKSNHLDLAVKGGFNFGTMLYGNQKNNNSTYDLKAYDEFTGLVFRPSLGLQVKCNLSEYGYLSIGYDYSKSVNLSNETSKKLFFKTHQILFGIHFELY
jgi:hypothetical protein